MSNERSAHDDAPFLDAVGELGPALLKVLAAFDEVQRRLHPPELSRLRAAVAPARAFLEEALAAAGAEAPPPRLEEFARVLLASAGHAARGLELFLADEAAADEPMAGIAAVMGALREHSRAQAVLFPLRRAATSIDRYFLEAGAESRSATLAEAPGTPGRSGLFNANNDPEQRGGFSFFAPEDYDEARAWPLVVALHGGFGHGGDFLWTWLREARTRGWLLLAPTSRDTTWSMLGADHDAPALTSMLAYVDERWNVDARCRLLTGLSDGGTYSLLHGLAEGSGFTALAPVAGVLHPGNFSNANLERAAGVRIRWVHGALDWMFPVQLAREGARALGEAGADVELVEVDDLSHAYPREQNGPILEWAQGTAQNA